MNNKLDSNVYMTVFIISFIGFIIAFFLGVWVGGKSAAKKSTPISAIQTEEKIMTSYEEPIQEETFKQEKTEIDIPEKKPEKTKKVKKIADNKTKKTTPKTKKAVKKEKETSKQKSNTKGKTTEKTGVKETRFMLQIGAFNKLKDAERLKKRFEKKGYSVFIVKEKGKRKIFYKVRIGVFYSKKIALKVKSKIKREDGINPWLVPIN